MSLGVAKALLFALAIAFLGRASADVEVISAIEASMVNIPFPVPFQLAVTEVTQRQWQEVMNGDPERLRSEHYGCDDCPVVYVNWSDVEHFLERLNARSGGRFRLPSGAEWEFACRAGANHRYCGGDDIDQVAWHEGNSNGRVQPVAKRLPNAWGLYDMSGNAWEWTSDCLVKGLMSCESANLRGGSWFSTYGCALVSTVDADMPVNSRTQNDGFRLARSLP